MTYRSNVFLPLNALALLGIVMSFYWSLDWTDLVMFLIGWFLFVGLGAAAGMHRVFAHRTHVLPQWKKLIVLFCTTMSCQGPTIWWCSMHRGLHHRFADTDKDPHSPTHGVYHAMVGWMDKAKVDAMSMRYAPDLMRDPDHRWFQENYNTIIPGVWLCFALLLGFQWFIFLFILPVFIGLWRDNIENAITHIKGFGYRNFDTNDNSTNVLWVMPFGFGNCFHNNHHYDPASYDFGSGISGKWWEFDLARVFLPFLESKHVGSD